MEGRKNEQALIKKKVKKVDEGSQERDGTIHEGMSY